MPDQPPSLSKLSIFSANVTGFGQKQKRTKFFLHLKNQNPDIVMLCDTRLNSESEKFLINEVNYKCYFNSYSSDRRGVAILVKKSLPINIVEKYKDNIGNVLTLEATYDSNIFLITCIYGPNDDNPDFFEDIFNRNSALDCPYQIIGGDFNVTLDHSIDNFAYANPRNNRARSKLNQLLIDYNFFDVYRSTHPIGKHFTWKNNGGRQRARLDMFIASQSFRPFILNYSKLPPIQSDHDILKAEIDFTKFTRGKGYWRHNNSLLKDPEYVNRIKNHFRLTLAKYVSFNNFDNFFTEANEFELQNFLNHDNNFYFEQDYTIDPHQLLEVILNDARCEAISFQAEKVRQSKAEEDRITLSLNVAKCISEQNPENDDAFDRYSAYLAQYNDFIDDKAKQQLLDRGITNKTLGEKPTSYFLNLEKNNTAQRYITHLKVEKHGNTSTISRQNDIENEIRDYYRNLYTNKDNYLTLNSIEDFFDEDLLNVQYNRLTDHQANQLEGLITEDELLKILKKGRNDSAPGLSGFTYQFFKFFWCDLKFFLLSAANYSFTTKKLPAFQSRGVISIIPKGNKSKDILDNWRPLTILNVFYKLVSGVIAARINSVLDKIIHGDQSGFVPGRYIGDCLRTTYDIITRARERRVTGLLLLIDFRKAYDSISFKYIKNALTFFGFGNDMTSWVDILLHNFKACVVHAGHLSELFDILIGCRQGDPVASPLFLISIEILCIKLRSSNKLEWFNIDNLKVLLSLYADDMTIFMPYRATCLRGAISIMEMFYKLSGLQLQKKKTQVCIFGQIPQGNLNICPDIELKWAQEFELLGIYFTGNLENMDTNVARKLAEIDKITGYWKYRFVTPLGRAVIAKSLLLSKINHIAFALPTLSSKLIQTVENKIYNFIWGKTVCVARKDAQKKEYEGGLAMPDVNASWAAFKISWLRRLENSNSTWAKLFLQTLTQIKPTASIEEMLYNTGTAELLSLSKKFENPFWKEVLKSYKPIFTNFLKKHPENILFTPIWNSHSFLMNNKPCTGRNFNSVRFVAFPSDIMSEKNGLLDFLEVEEVQNIRNIMINPDEYISLKQIIRNGMAALRFNFQMHRLANPSRPSGKVFINLSEKGCNKWTALYRYGSTNTIATYERNWEENLGNRQGILFWERCYKNVKNIFFDNKIKLFYYLIIRGTLRTNRIATHHVNIGPNCSYCQNTVETILHLFWDCPITKRFINEVSARMDIIYPNYFLQPTRNKFIFGFKDENIYDKNNLLNLYIKSYIWRLKFGSEILNVDAFIKWVYYEWRLNFESFNDNRFTHLAITIDRLRLSIFN